MGSLIVLLPALRLSCGRAELLAPSGATCPPSAHFRSQLTCHPPLPSLSPCPKGLQGPLCPTAGLLCSVESGPRRLCWVGICYGFGELR